MRAALKHLHTVWHQWNPSKVKQKFHPLPTNHPKLVNIQMKFLVLEWDGMFVGVRGRIFKRRLRQKQWVGRG